MVNVGSNVASHVLGFLKAWQPQGGQRWLRDPRTSVSAEKIRVTWHNTEMTALLPLCSKDQSNHHPAQIQEEGAKISHWKSVHTTLQKGPVGRKKHWDGHLWNTLWHTWKKY